MSRRPKEERMRMQECIASLSMRPCVVDTASYGHHGGPHCLTDSLHIDRSLTLQRAGTCLWERGQELLRRGMIASSPRPQDKTQAPSCKQHNKALVLLHQGQVWLLSNTPILAATMFDFEGVFRPEISTCIQIFALQSLGLLQICTERIISN